MANTRKNKTASASKSSASKKTTTGSLRAPRAQSSYRATTGRRTRRTTSRRTATVTPFTADIRKAIDSAVAQGRALRGQIEQRITARFKAGSSKRKK